LPIISALGQNPKKSLEHSSAALPQADFPSGRL
jgi:hypothetical protein